tara:strand:- start:5824 stop:6402 length:579 start_codon:yes stop_codon:yes gene_type:complete
MKFTCLVVDNFIQNPNEMREFGLSIDFNEYNPNNYPGIRSNPYEQKHILAVITNLLKPFYTNVIYNPGVNSGQFQVTTINDMSWVHVDDTKGDAPEWLYEQYHCITCVLYLTPNAPEEAGTSFFINENEKPIKNSLGYIDDNPPKYKKIETIANKFNRILLFDSTLYHSSDCYFGTNKYDGRLTTTYFFLAK